MNYETTPLKGRREKKKEKKPGRKRKGK